MGLQSERRINNGFNGIVVVTQFTERSLPTLEAHGLNPVIGDFFNLFTLNCIEKTKIKKNRREWTI